MLKNIWLTTYQQLKARKDSMAKEQITTDRLGEPIGHFSQATTIEATGKLVFISGMVALRPDGTIAGIGDIEAQTTQVCENLKAAVEAAGGLLDDICRVDVYVRNMEHFDVIHKVRRKYFKPPLPASTMVEVTKMVSPDYLIEISAIAVLKDSWFYLQDSNQCAENNKKISVFLRVQLREPILVQNVIFAIAYTHLLKSFKYRVVT